jgi:hypothetical protein
MLPISSLIKESDAPIINAPVINRTTEEKVEVAQPPPEIITPPVKESSIQLDKISNEIQRLEAELEKANEALKAKISEAQTARETILVLSGAITSLKQLVA